MITMHISLRTVIVLVFLIVNPLTYSRKKILWNSMGSINCLVTKIPQITLFCVYQK